MFAWLDDVAPAIRRHPEILFVIRAHPDEDRPGKASQESVAEWVGAQGLERLENLVFFSPGTYVSSYELIERSKAVLVYNSSIGLEAAIMGVPVLCAGRARYAEIAPSLLPESEKEYRQRLESLLNADEIELAGETARKARAFLYTELNQASLDFSEFLAPYPVLPGMVTFQGFEPARLERSPALETVAKGILERRPFELANGPIPGR